MGAAYKLKQFYGDLPLHEAGPNTGRLNQGLIAEQYGFEYKAVFKAYHNWQHIFRLDGSDLTFRQYLDMLKASNLTPSMIGNQKEQYNLSRYGDKGVYTSGNCRFITRLENLQEQDH